MKRRIVVLLISILVITVPFDGNAQETTFFAMGVGNKSCGAYLQASASERALRPPNAVLGGIYDMDYFGFYEFTEGFLTGVNWINPTDRHVGENSDFGGRAAWLENYCRAHPLEKFLNAVIFLRQELIHTGQ